MKKRELIKKITATALSLIMVIGLLPVSAFAAEENPSYEMNDLAVDDNTDSVTVDVIYDTYSGTVTGGGDYKAGDAVTLIATPDEYMKFAYWLDATVQFEEEPAEEELKAAIVSYDAEYTFTATTNVTLEAVFFSISEISVFPMLITGTDEESLMDAEWIADEGNTNIIKPGAEPITLPNESIETIITIAGKQYELVGFIVFGYDEVADAVTVELKEAMTIDAMPLYDSAEFWDWFVPISDGIYVAYMEYTPTDNDDDEPQTPDTPDTPDEPQTPDTPDTPEEPDEPQTPDTPEEPDEPQTPDTSNDPEQPDEPQTPTSPKTGDNSQMALWAALLFVSGGALMILTVVDRKRRTAKR